MYTTLNVGANMDELLAKVPADKQEKLREIAAITDKFCVTYLNEEFRLICRELAAVASVAGVPLDSGKTASWAAGILATIAYVNFLGDPAQPIYMTTADMAKRIGISAATMQSKSKTIRDTLEIDRLDPQFATQNLNEQNPFVWLVRIDGAIVDIRTASREDQKEAFGQGQIPYIPDDGPSKIVIRHWEPTEIEPQPEPKTKKSAKKSTAPARLYTLEVAIHSGPMSDSFVKKNPTITRTIEIRGDQTLEDLHEVIFDAFDRDDPHMYEFQFGKRPMDRNGPRYLMPEGAEHEDESQVAGLVHETTIDDLALRVKKRFWYWFDFGDDWHHQIDVMKIADAPTKGKFPRIARKVGKSPPQYIDWDEA